MPRTAGRATFRSFGERVQYAVEFLQVDTGRSTKRPGDLTLDEAFDVALHRQAHGFRLAALALLTFRLQLEMDRHRLSPLLG